MLRRQRLFRKRLVISWERWLRKESIFNWKLVRSILISDLVKDSAGDMVAIWEVMVQAWVTALIWEVMVLAIAGDDQYLKGWA